ncbi:MAG TPA: hypothetical protein DIW44_12580 [Anaerolineaceae bacterium]|nr:hypothetical protein [Anaerolineaceae bacterium]
MNFDSIGTIVAIFIGICALGVSIWQGWETRKSYRLSVTPNVCITSWWISDDDYLGISLTNNGIGPAVLTKISISIDNQVYDVLNNPTIFFKALRSTNQFGESIDFNKVYIDFGEFIPVGETLPLIWLMENDKTDELKIQIFQDMISKISILVEYKSIYGQVFSTSGQKLT